MPSTTFDALTVELQALRLEVRELRNEVRDIKCRSHFNLYPDIRHSHLVDYQIEL